MQLLRDSGLASAFWADSPKARAFTNQAAKGGFLATAARTVLPLVLRALRYALPKLLAGIVGDAGSAAVQKAIKAATGAGIGSIGPPPYFGSYAGSQGAASVKLRPEGW